MMNNLNRNLESSFKLDDNPVDKIDDLFGDFKYVKNNKKIEYLNVACAFDIESTSFYNEAGEKSACMYAFVLGMNGKIITGRTWDEALDYIQAISDRYCSDKEHRIVIYVHNLSFEFQWFRKRFEWDKVFALSEREVAYALTTSGIEFRCSYILSGYSLAKLGEQCTYYPVQKMVGDLDYKLARHSQTPLTDKEWKYIYNDCLVVMSYIQQQIELEDNNISNIPLTKTGYVRRYCRNKCLYEGTHKNSHKYLQYHKIIKSLTITSFNEYKQLKRAFIGGHSHGNPLIIGQTLSDVTSMDFTSSYPYCMLSEKYPMSKGQKINIKSKEEFYKNIELYCCIFDITFYNIESITPFEHFIPSSKCFNKEGIELDNGKVIRADKITMSLTEVDFKTISKFYKWDSIGIKNFRRYMKGYLPKNFIMAILKLYKDKTELKGVEEKYIEYMQSKASLNASYGMAVTDICRDEITYDGLEWGHEEPDYEKMLTKYNQSKNRFLYYIWGLYVTAYAKSNLASGILELQYDYLYADTDSVKFLNYEKHKDYFETYNNNCKKKLLDMINFYKLDPADIEPKTIKGETKLLGVWDYDGHYKRFRCLGSKRYMVEYDDGHHSFTVAGCSKKKAIPYMEQLAKDRNMDVMDLFDDELYIPKEFTNKNIHAYIDYKQDGILKDYLGNECEYHELSSVHLEACEFTLSLSANFADYILGLRGVL